MSRKNGPFKGKVYKEQGNRKRNCVLIVKKFTENRGDKLNEIFVKSIYETVIKESLPLYKG